MKQALIHVALVVRDYDEAIDFYVNKLNFELIEDTYQAEQNKRWVVVSPPGSKGMTLLLAKASKPEQHAFIGNQCGGRVFLFLSTDDFWRDYHNMLSKGITFVRQPQQQDLSWTCTQTNFTVGARGSIKTEDFDARLAGLGILDKKVRQVIVIRTVRKTLELSDAMLSIFHLAIRTNPEWAKQAVSDTLINTSTVRYNLYKTFTGPTSGYGI